MNSMIIKIKHILITSLAVFCISMMMGTNVYAQGSPDYNGGYKIKFDDEGKKYLRIIGWLQFQTIYTVDKATEDNFNFLVRRARILMLSQITPKFQMVAHFGANSWNSGNSNPVGNGGRGQLFWHDFFGQYTIAKNTVLGAGLHYYKGISRLNNSSTLNFLTLDNNGQSWPTLGLADQFGRHMGIFLKGSLGSEKRFQYRIAINDAIEVGLDARNPRDPDYTTQIVYGGRKYLNGKGDKVYEGYFEYNLWDVESNFLPYKVGTYLGGKKVFNLGAGFFSHPNGTVSEISGSLEGHSVLIWAFDAYLDMPVSDSGSAVSAYATFQNNFYGENYFHHVRGGYGTGNMIYGQFAYLLPGSKEDFRYQLYATYVTQSYEAITTGSKGVTGLGLNIFMSGHHAKLTAEYLNSATFGEDKKAVNVNVFKIQAMFYL